MKILKITMISAMAIMIIAGCSSNDASQNNTVQKIAVQVEPVSYGNITVTKTYSGTLEGARQSKVWASIPERVISIPKTEGSYVKAGEPIVVLDKGGAASMYNQARAVYLNAKDNYEKMKNLYDQRAISEVDYNSAKTQYEVSMADFEAAKASVELSVPIDGIVTEVAVNLGDRTPMGIPIATVANTEKMRLTIYVVLDVVGKLKIGQKAEVFANSLDPVTAEITRISRSADPETRLFRVELEMNNKQGLLKPGMFAKTRIVVDELHNILIISRRAIFTEEGVPKAYVIQNDSAFVKTLETGVYDDSIMQVLDGVEENQRVVVVGKSALRDKAPVTISQNEG